MKKILLYLAPLMIAHSAFAQDPTVPAPKPAAHAQKVDMKQVQKANIESGGASRAQIIQNRLYSVAHKFEFGLLGSYVATDPFLSVKSYGFSLGYHLNETWAINGIYWKDSVSPSQALNVFQSSNGFTVNTVNPVSFYGGEIQFSPIYGKLNVLDMSIVHFDLHLSAGAGERKTDSGTYLAFMAGIGQQIFLTSWLTLGVDFRLLKFSQDIREKVVSPNVPNPLGSVIGNTSETSSVTTLSMNFLFGG